jgi:hypothetical protein
MKRLAIVLAICTLLLFGAVAPALADDGDMGDIGGTLQPIESTTIRMESETVQAVVYGSFAEYRCDFRFVNDGPARTVEFGFPFQLPSSDSAMKYWRAPVAFHAWRNGVALQVTPRNGIDHGSPTLYYTHTARLSHGATMISVDYIAIPDTYDSGGQYEYVLHSGAPWAGTIGKVVMRYSISSEFATSSIESGFRDQLVFDGRPTSDDKVATSYTRPTPSVFQWVFTNIEPRLDSYGDTPYDIAVPFDWDDSSSPSPTPDMHATASSYLELDYHDYTPDLLVDGDPTTAWAEGATNDGTGQSFRVSLGEEQPVKEVRVLPGYVKRPDLFLRYNRPSRMLVQFSDGSHYVLNLKDDASYQRFPVDARATWAKFTILGVYRGTTRNETYVSEVEFGKQPAPRFLPYADLVRMSAPTSGTALPRLMASIAAEKTAVAQAGARKAGQPTRTLPAKAGTPREPIPPLSLAVLGVTLVAVAGLLWKMTP